MIDFSENLCFWCLALLSVFAAYILILMFRSTAPNITRYDAEKYYETTNGKFAFPNINDEASVDLSVIVPSYNEQERLPTMLEETVEFLEAKQAKEVRYKYEIIVVDDGSKDKTTEVAMKFSEKYGSDKIRVLTLVKNRGKGGAVRLGMLSARGKKLLFADADAATRFSDIDKVEERLNAINKEPHGMAISVGSRAHLENASIASRSLFRTLLMKGFHLLVWLFCVRSVRDSQCGFKLFTREAARATFLNLHVERWAFDVELLYIAEELGIPITEGAVKWTEIDGSKIVPIFSWLQMGKDIVFIWLYHRFNIWKIKKAFD